jgi:CheY-like chemotaxis protein
LNAFLDRRYRFSAGPEMPIFAAASEGIDTEDLETEPRMKESKTILICDDEPTLRELVRASLNGGYRFAEASDGFVAIDLARELDPDLIVLDLMLPRLSGLEVLAQLRSDDHLRAIPVLVMTAWNDTKDAAMAAGADSFLSKPFHPDDLKVAVEELLA